MTKSIFLVLIAATAATQLQSLKLGRRAKVSQLEDIMVASISLLDYWNQYSENRHSG